MSLATPADPNAAGAPTIPAAEAATAAAATTATTVAEAVVQAAMAVAAPILPTVSAGELGPEDSASGVGEGSSSSDSAVASAIATEGDGDGSPASEEAADSAIAEVAGDLEDDAEDGDAESRKELWARLDVLLRQTELYSDRIAMELERTRKERERKEARAAAAAAAPARKRAPPICEGAQPAATRATKRRKTTAVPAYAAAAASKAAQVSTSTKVEAKSETPAAAKDCSSVAEGSAGETKVKDESATPVPDGRRRSARNAAKREATATAGAVESEAPTRRRRSARAAVLPTPAPSPDFEEGEEEDEEAAAAAGGPAPRTPAEIEAELFKGVLNDYQVEGVNWLDSLYINGANGILADEMGLGKTVQTISFLCRQYSRGAKNWGLSLVVGPLSTLANWESEFDRFAPGIPKLVYHGTKEERVAMQHEVKRLVNRANTRGPGSIQRKLDLPVLLTSYEMINYDIGFLRKLNFRYLTVDEGHRLKNQAGLCNRNMRQIQTIHRILLTGTPLQNDLGELWSLLNFVLPAIFDNVDDFLKWFGDFAISGSKLDKHRILSREMTNNIVSKCHAILKPVMLRRVKSEVNLKLPPKKEIVVSLPMTAEQKALYVSIKEKRMEEYMIGLFTAAGAEPPKPSRYSFRTSVMAARRACCHPFLFPHPLFPNVQDYTPDESLVTTSGKMLVLDKLLRELLQNDGKAIIFSQFSTMIDILEDYMHLREWQYSRIDGMVHQQDRKEAIARFQTDSDCKVFLATTRAGGLGINLTAANSVILYDSDWNPQQDLQAQDRAHRMGQERPVTVFRLLADHAFESYMFERANAKRKLEKMVIQQGQFSDPTRRLSKRAAPSRSSSLSVPSSPGPNNQASSSGNGASVLKVVAKEATAPATAAAADGADATFPEDVDDDGEPTDKAFLRSLLQLFDQEDCTKIAALQPGEEVLSDANLQHILAMRASF